MGSPSSTRAGLKECVTGWVHALIADDGADLKVMKKRKMGGYVLEKLRPRMTEVSLKVAIFKYS